MQFTVTATSLGEQALGFGASRQRWRSARVGGVLAAVLGAFAMLAPCASAGWSAPAEVPTVGMPQSDAIGIDGSGQAVAAWAQLSLSDTETVDAAATVNGTNVWGVPVVLSAAGTQAMFPQIAVAPSGAAAAVWQAYRSSSATTLPYPPATWAAYRPAGGTEWSAPVEISSGGGLDPSVAIDDREQATAVWSRLPDGVAVASYDPRTRAWSRPTVLRTAVSAAPGTVAEAPSGEAVVVWRQSITGSIVTGGTSSEVAASVRATATSRWGATQQLGREIEPPLQGDRTWEEPGPQVAIDAAGDAIVAWQGGRPPTPVVSVATYTASTRRWRDRGAIERGSALWPQVAVSPQGDATVGWLNADGQPAVSSASVTLGRWSVPTVLSTVQGSYPHIAVDRWDDAIATWIGSQGTESAAVRIGTHGRWRRPIQLGPTIDYEGAAADAISADGVAVVLWTEPDTDISFWSAAEALHTTADDG